MFLNSRIAERPSAGRRHMFAQNTSDVFLAQGFNIARDRLFQVDT
jgi:penicillin amidase